MERKIYPEIDVGNDTVPSSYMSRIVNLYHIWISILLMKIISLIHQRN